MTNATVWGTNYKNYKLRERETEEAQTQIFLHRSHPLTL